MHLKSHSQIVLIIIFLNGFLCHCNAQNIFEGYFLMKSSVVKETRDDDVGPKRESSLYFLGRKLPKKVHSYCFNDSKYPIISTADYVYSDSISANFIDSIISKSKGYIDKQLKIDMLGAIGGYVFGEALNRFPNLEKQGNIYINYFFKARIKVYLYKKKVPYINCNNVEVSRSEYLYFREKENVCQLLYCEVFPTN